MTSAETREALRRILLRRSVRTGDFTLASGQRSSVYVDARLTTCHAAAIPLIGRLVLERIREKGWQPVAVGGLTMGADPISVAVARESLEAGPAAGSAVDAFVVRKEAKKHGMKRFVEGIEITSPMDVVVIDDVCSTGGSTATAIERCREAGMNVLGAVCLVDREMGAVENLRRDVACELVSVFRLSELTGAGT